MTGKLQKELTRATRFKDPAERAVRVAAVVAEALRSIGQDPVLVGGAAVEFYTQGGYSTRDIDLVAEGGKELLQVMTALGFEKIGKDFIDRRRKIYLEFPSSTLKPGEETMTIQVGSRSLRVVSIEDLIADRLCAFKFWRSGIDGVNALLLLELGQADEARLLHCARREEVIDALEILYAVRETIIRERLSRDQSNKLLEKKMRML